jgi:hypothetical protein
VKSLYQRMIEIGATVDNQESDLYVKATPETYAVVTACDLRWSTFKATDGSPWIEIPFAFDPWWESHRAPTPAASPGEGG